MRQEHDAVIEDLMEQIIANGTEDMASVFAGLFDLAMRIEREQFLGAGHYERTSGRRGYANGYKAKKLDTPAGTLSLNVPKTAGHLEGCGEPFFPQSLERGRRSSRAVMLAVAEMYVKGVSTRDAEAIMKEFGIESLSSTQVSRATKLLDDELSAWRNRPLSEIRYLIVDARYEKSRIGGVVRDVAVLYGNAASSIWHKMQSITHPARKPASASGPNYAKSGTRPIWRQQQRTCVCWWKTTATRLQAWPNGSKTMCQRDWPSSPCLNTIAAAWPTSNPIERGIQQELKRRTRKVRVFPNIESLERLVSAVLVEIDDKWAAADKGYIKWEKQDD